MQLTRTEQPRIRSAYTRQNPPPDEPPKGVDELTGWQLAAAQWRRHLPDDLLGVDCVVCQIAWPCDAWEIANDIINSSRDNADRAPIEPTWEETLEERPRPRIRRAAQTEPA
ncbi:MAG TPA: hypothetical protein H9881_15660 [Candidatus Stackebrandtia excrementipullorum]|nr:hypothetical protein [Candidatus Stackebrandtia excrementipullorum]